MAHLNIIPEHLVVADLERLDARTRALALLHLLQERFAVTGKGMQLIECPVVARADDAAVAHGQPRLVHNRAFQDIAQIVKGLDSCVHAHEEIALCRAEVVAYGRECGERDTEGDEVARICRLRFNARQKAREVIDRTQLFAQGSAQRGLLNQLRHGIETRVDAMWHEQRMLKPRFQEARPHRRAREIEHVKERVLLAAVTQAARDLKIAERVGVKLHRIRCIEKGEVIQL